MESQVLVRYVVFTSLMLLTSSCGGLLHTGEVVRPTASPSKDGADKFIPPPGQETGSYLYGEHCSSCHGALDSSTKKGRTAAQITNALNVVPQMRHIRDKLKEPQVELLAKALVPGHGPVEPETLDGPTLYAQNCASCHNELSRSNRRGSTASAIEAAISSVPTMRPLAKLGSSQINLIASALALTGLNDDGPTLYANNCANCHGALANSTRIGYSAVSITNAISNANSPGYSAMRFLSFLSPSDLTKIAAALNQSRRTVNHQKRPKLMNRAQLYSRLRRVFGTGLADANLRSLATMVNSDMLGRPEYFGGNCDNLSTVLKPATGFIDRNNYDQWGGKLCFRDDNHLNAPSSPFSSALRAGALNKVCSRIASQDVFVNAALASAGLSSTSPVTTENIRILVTSMTLYQPSNSSLNAIKALSDGEATKGRTGIDLWRFVVIPICSSAMMETL